VSTVPLRTATVKPITTVAKPLGRLALCFGPTCQNSLPCAFAALFGREVLGASRAAFSAECNRVWVFHALSIYVAVGISQAKYFAPGPHFSLDKHT